MKYFEVEGRTAEQAVNNFLTEKDIPKDFIEYEVLKEASKGFLGFGRKNALVKLKFNDVEFYTRKAKLVLSEILEKAGFADYSIETKNRNPDIILNIVSPDSKLLIGKNAQMLDSMQFILNRMLAWQSPDFTFIVDVEEYRERVVENLKEKAVKLAKTVRRTGKPIKMAPMVTMVRKEIHMVLKEVPGISTVSKGDGHLKEILIVPERKGGGAPRGRRPDNRKPRQRRPQREGQSTPQTTKPEGSE
ncbi:single-stranded nucleic acid binding R3H domain protein [Denitrovibrio acetiphilus DSM 12809]|uniref:Single-stranded nucleic acid binding R3H domain protein n=1 Tax=Denitrovibrio acetiphilus (strain DSM 12809 / NBRC 114555 / N2460) TaxID=522772 RepID=D4H195_DENA2|nr:Jag N-terminal domain-containing protein [Denitrovibrio acetiphilus]ADD66843.1 single-stranded nucleic acid binding R3H domain protein [Denitrovibrio acetiphilus DSM 12809]